MVNKYYVEDLQLYENIMVFDELHEFAKEDENGHYYWEDKKDFDWWQTLANNLQAIEDFNKIVDLEDNEQLSEEWYNLNENIDEYDDYNTIANQIDELKEKYNI